MQHIGAQAYTDRGAPKSTIMTCHTSVASPQAMIAVTRLPVGFSCSTSSSAFFLIPSTRAFSSNWELIKDRQRDSTHVICRERALVL